MGNLSVLGFGYPVQPPLVGHQERISGLTWGIIYRDTTLPDSSGFDLGNYMIPLIMENQMVKQMENEMETGIT